MTVDPGRLTPSDPRLSAMRATFQALFDASSEVAEWDQERFDRFIRIVEETGLLLFGYPKRWPTDQDIYGTFDELRVMVDGATRDLALAIVVLRRALAAREAPEARAEETAHIVSADRQAATEPPVEPASDHASALHRAADPTSKPSAAYAAFSRERAEAVPNPRTNIPETIPVAASIDAGPEPALSLDSQSEASEPAEPDAIVKQKAAWEPSYDVAAMYAALRSEGTISSAARVLGITDQAVRFRLDKLRDRGMLADDIAAMRRSPSAGDKVVELPGIAGPAPLPEQPRAPDDFDGRRRAQAAAAAEKAWAQSHPGEVRA